MDRCWLCRVNAPSRDVCTPLYLTGYESVPTSPVSAKTHDHFASQSQSAWSLKETDQGHGILL